MNPITIRKAKTDDVIELSELFYEFIGVGSDLTAMKIQIEITSNNPNYYVAVACDGNRVVGTAMGIVCYDLVGNCNPFMLAENVVVSSEYQGRGIGKLLMQALEDFGQMNQCNYVILVSGSKRETAHKFYESIGYSPDHKGFKKRLKQQI
ncbi:GNAT family N-acetyltransferase [Cohnella abietis]|uniref:N-acetyltransferase n=1 Tax=Cohnella abietis TaxID=2507935 RepID=A0A3T1CYI6_9BACL|nr:GNAT family N-acetyltransferase [Cohnella abietis]BBI30927.1 N-acetyltransferase [Cohnella abietis]